MLNDMKERIARTKNHAKAAELIATYSILILEYNPRNLSKWQIS